MLGARPLQTLVLAFLPETYHPVCACSSPLYRAVHSLTTSSYPVLAKQAKKMCKADPEKNKDVYAELEHADFSFKSILTCTIARPFLMLSVEPSLALVTLYLSVM